jgi:hypothetical protein
VDAGANAVKTEVINVSEKTGETIRTREIKPTERKPRDPEMIKRLGGDAIKGKQRADLQNAQRVGQTALRGERKSEPKRDEPTR